MSHPASSSSPDTLDPPISGALLADFRASWSAWFEPLKQGLRDAPPTRDSYEELSALTSFANGLLSVFRAYDPGLVSLLLHTTSQRKLADLVRRESDRAPTERKLALRFLQRAFEVLDVVRANLVIPAEDDLASDPSPRIVLSASAHEAFEALLDDASPPSDRLKRLLRRDAS